MSIEEFLTVLDWLTKSFKLPIAVVRDADGKPGVVRIRQIEGAEKTNRISTHEPVGRNDPLTASGRRLERE
jgi:hypothetical protein